jgi:predicted nucleotide-binding protein
MEKTQKYRRVRFVPDAIQELENYIIGTNLAKPSGTKTFKVELQGEESWDFDTFDEFLAEYPKAIEATYLRFGVSNFQVQISLIAVYDGPITTVRITAENREIIQKIFNIVEKYRERSTIPLPAKPESEPEPEVRPVVFIGHGRSQQWRDLKDHLHEKHGYEIVAYEIGAREGHTIRDIIEEMLDRSSMAFLVLTGEDETADHRFLARQNVVHEAGLFQGRLGFPRAIIMLEDGTEEFSNIAGIQQIRYSKGKIKETFGDVLAVLKREFGT